MSNVASASKPATRPTIPNFSCGPCAKRPGWSPEALAKGCLGRSHRSGPGKAKLKEAIALSRQILGIPDDYLVGIVAASDTGAMEMAMWSLLGQRPVDVFAWESFGREWTIDVLEQLKLTDARSFLADYGQIPDLAQANPDHDIIFTWNGTSGGVRVPHVDWIAADRKGLTICDATSAVFAMPLDWRKLDVVTWSWQKVLGGEAQHGLLVLSPRAVARLESWTPSWPIPKLFRMTKKGKLIKGIFEGETINTPSMLCVEDAIDAMNWVQSIGGVSATIARTNANFTVLSDWIKKTTWIDFLVVDETVRSPTSVTMKITDPEIVALSREAQAEFCKKLTGLLEKEGVAYDINGYRDAPPGLRIWCGATIEASDMAAMLPWIEWAFASCKAELKAAA